MLQKVVTYFVLYYCITIHLLFLRLRSDEISFSSHDKHHVYPYVIRRSLIHSLVGIQTGSLSIKELGIFEKKKFWTTNVDVLLFFLVLWGWIDRRPCAKDSELVYLHRSWAEEAKGKGRFRMDRLLTCREVSMRQLSIIILRPIIQKEVTVYLVFWHGRFYAIFTELAETSYASSYLLPPTNSPIKYTSR